jgi:hypothetical protein
VASLGRLRAEQRDHANNSNNRSDNKQLLEHRVTPSS